MIANTRPGSFIAHVVGVELIDLVESCCDNFLGVQLITADFIPEPTLMDYKVDRRFFKVNPSRLAFNCDQVTVELSSAQLSFSCLFEYLSPEVLVSRPGSCGFPPSSSVLLLQNPHPGYVALRPYSVIFYRDMITTDVCALLKPHQIQST